MTNDRIRSLESFVKIDKNTPETEERLRERAVVEMGHEIAKKLFEFHKVTKLDRGDHWLFWSRIEVIVPIAPPKVI